MAGEMLELAKTKLGQAIKIGHVDDVRKLISSGENVLAKDRKGNTYLHYISTMYRPYAINHLFECGIDINATNIHGFTALHVTALQAEPCHVPDLMAAGIDPGITDFAGKTAAQLANNQSKWLDLYNKYEPGLRQAVADRNMDRIIYLLHAWSACHLVVDGKDMRHFAASLTYHDIVSLIDKHRFSIMAVYAVLTKNYERLKYAISRGPATCNVNYLQLLKRSRAHHMLQHAIRQNSFKMVEMICDAGADLNLFVEAREYYRAPLYFEGLLFDGSLDRRIIDKILSCDIDLTLKDERGRSALHYVIDRRNGRVTVDVVEKLLEMDINIALRDENGSTARDIAIFERRKDIIEAIDQHLVNFVRATDMDNLMKLAIEGYDGIIVEYQYRDTWIFASGNTNNIVTTFVEEFPEYQKLGYAIHRAIEEAESIDEIQYMVDSYESKSFSQDRLLQFKDKGGRNMLMKAVLFADEETIEWLLERDVPHQLECRDNIGRGIAHYKEALRDNIGVDHLFQNVKLQRHIDFLGHDADSLQEDFIETERKMTYGLSVEVDCAVKYEKLIKFIRSTHRKKSHFDRVLKELKYPLANIPIRFHKNPQAPLVADYTDLLFEAIDHERMDIACKIAFLGADCSIRKPYYDVLWDNCAVWLNAEERAQHLGLTELVNIIRRYGSDKNYWGLGVKRYVQMYLEQEQLNRKLHSLKER